MGAEALEVDKFNQDELIHVEEKMIRDSTPTFRDWGKKEEGREEEEKARRKVSEGDRTGEWFVNAT